MDSILLLFEKVEDLLEKDQFELIDIIFQNIELEKLSPDILVGILRVTSPASDEIPSFQETTKAVQKELEKRSLNSKELLAGLL